MPIVLTNKLGRIRWSPSDHLTLRARDPLSDSNAAANRNLRKPALPLDWSRPCLSVFVSPQTPLDQLCPGISTP